ncbi:MAG: hypothetical protein WDM77_17735 [Steroidobacteraceae bacterium]
MRTGWGTAPDLTGAAEQYQAAAERGYDWGEYNFGNLAVRWPRRAL